MRTVKLEIVFGPSVLSGTSTCAIVLQGDTDPVWAAAYLDTINPAGQPKLWAHGDHAIGLMSQWRRWARNNDVGLVFRFGRNVEWI